MKLKRPLFEGWKTALISSITAKLIYESILFFLCSSITARVIEFPHKYSAHNINYVNKHGWFMYLCFGLMIVFDIVSLLRIIISSQHKLQKKQTNHNLNLFEKSSRVRAEKFCFKTMIWLMIPAVLMTGYVKYFFKRQLFTLLVIYAIIYIIVLVTIIKSRIRLSKHQKKRNEKLMFLKASQVEYMNFAAYILDENAIIIENLTNYMISSFATGNFINNDIFVYDLHNELDPWLEDVPEYKYDISSRKHHIIVADCDLITDINSFVEETYKKFRYNSSKYAYLTIGLVNFKNTHNNTHFQTGLAKDFSVITFPSYKKLDIASLAINRLTVIRELGTPAENAEVVRIAKEGISDDEVNLYTDEIIRESKETLGKDYNGAFEPDYSYISAYAFTKKVKSKRTWNIFTSRSGCHFLADPERRLSGKLRNHGLNPEINPDNEYLYSIFKNMLFEPSDVKKIMATFDYIDFMLRTVSIYYHIKNDGNSEDYEVCSNFYDISRQIILLSSEDNQCIRKVISCDSYQNIIPILGYMKEYLNVISVTNDLDFCGLCHFLDIVRNKTRGHGSVKEENCHLIQCILLFFTELLHDMLDIKNFNIIVKENTTYMGYKSERYNCNQIVYSHEGLPCIPIRVQGERKEYINFFKGRYIVPDFISEA